MDRENFFDNLRNDSGEHDEALRAQRQLAYEERIIKRVFTECGVKISGWGFYANQCRRETGQDKLNFDWFNRAFPHFAGWLCGRRIPGLHELTLLDLFKPPEKNRLLSAVRKNLARCNVDVGADGPFAFVFPVTRTFFVAHSCAPREKSAERVLLSIGDNVWVEPTKTFCASIGADWFRS
jgi:hypothetical protein